MTVLSILGAGALVFIALLNFAGAAPLPGVTRLQRASRIAWALAMLAAAFYLVYDLGWAAILAAIVVGVVAVVALLR